MKNILKFIFRIKVKLDYEPGFSTGGRCGKSFPIVLKFSKYKPYLALKDERGVSWPL